MFYEIHKKPDDYMKIKYDIWHTEGNLYTTKQIKNMLATSKEDPDQEYLGKFVVGKDSVLGDVTDDERDDDIIEWVKDPEDDSYEEPDDHRNQSDDEEWVP